jgi:hypothetical protein
MNTLKRPWRGRQRGNMGLQVTLSAGWSDHSKENPDGPVTFLRDWSQESGALQVSWAEYRGGEVPNPSPETLVQLSSSAGMRAEFSELVDSFNGACAFGHFGSVVFRSCDYPRAQFWHLSDGRDFIMVTHIFGSTPDLREIEEAQEIVRSLVLVHAKAPWWRLWR